MTSTQSATPVNTLETTQIRPSDDMLMLRVPGGSFIMGSQESEVDDALALCLQFGLNCARRYFDVELPMHEVTLDDFWIDQTEVTLDQYQRCIDADICTPLDCEAETLGSGDHPVACVTWEQADAYCAWAGGRLPTEAEWEYAARGQAGLRYPWGDGFDGTKLNYCDANCEMDKRDSRFDDGYVRSAPVGSYPEGISWVGALDMGGNVWELVADWYGPYPEDSATNPTGPETGRRYVARGGSWNASPDHVRSALRAHMGIHDTVSHAGFRCAASVQ